MLKLRHLETKNKKTKKQKQTKKKNKQKTTTDLYQPIKQACVRKQL